MLSEITTQEAEHGFSNERMRTAQLAGWFLLEGIELTPAGNPITQPQELPFGSITSSASMSC